MLKLTIHCSVPPVLLLLIALCVPAVSYGQQFTRITPKWANDNPGRLEMSHGTAANGSNGYTFRLFNDQARRFTVLTRVSRRTDKEPRSLFETNVTSNEIKKSVVLNAAVWPSENIEVSFHVIEEKPVFEKERFVGFRSTHEYELRLTDFLNMAGKIPTVDFGAIKREAEAAARKKS